MKVIEKGHIYQTTIRKPDGTLSKDTGNLIVFINKEPEHEHDGTTTQEVLRVLIDRTRHCANCMPHPHNERIVYHLRMALGLHEARAIERKIEKGIIQPEYLETGADGHFKLRGDAYDAGELDTPELVPHRHDWDRPCNHPKPEEKAATAAKKKGGKQ